MDVLHVIQKDEIQSKKIFKRKLRFLIRVEYFTSCLLDAVTIGSTPITLDGDISDSSGISSPKQSRFFKHDKGKTKSMF
jgi:hypothetical protein